MDRTGGGTIALTTTRVRATFAPMPSPSIRTAIHRPPIHVTRSFQPPLEEVIDLLKEVWANGQYTNNGPLLVRLEEALREHLGLEHLLVTGNGTIALQLAIRALDLEGEVITTPYSYVASTTSILWEHCTPVFADIDPATFCIDPAAIEPLITARTTGILATHVYGLPCDVEAIEALAAKHGLKVIYDGAHAFGTSFKGRSLVDRGDVTTLSFHATKLYHTVEGGAVIARDPAVRERLFLMRSFGHLKDEHFMPGINGKNSELHAAVGLVNLRHFKDILLRRRRQWERYAGLLGDGRVRIATVPAGTIFNHAYFPAVLPAGALPRVLDALAAINVHPRRYFFPSLSKLPYLPAANRCPVAEDIAERVICLPLFHDLEAPLQDEIAITLLNAIG